MPISTYQVFTPTTQASLNFIERDTVNDQLVEALLTPGKQVVVYGETGSGKSTLLKNKLEQLYEGAVVTRCTEKTTYEALILAAFDQAAPYFEASSTYTESSAVKATLQAAFRAIKLGLEATRERSSSAELIRVVPPQLTIERLGQFIGEIGHCWVIEDFHKVPESEKAPIAQGLKVFCDLAQDYPEVKIIAVGATNTAREVIKWDAEMSNRVAEVEVPLMTDAEVRAIVENGGRILNISFGNSIEPLTLYSMGVAAICHQLCLNMCVRNGVLTNSAFPLALGPEDLRDALETYLRDTSDTMKSHFDLALRRTRVRQYDNARLILTALAALPPAGVRFNDILSQIRNVAESYPTGNLTAYLQRLQTDAYGGVVRQNHDGTYSFVDTFHHLYAFLRLQQADERKALPTESLNQELVDQALASYEIVLRSIRSLRLDRPSPDQLALWPSVLEAYEKGESGIG